MQKTATTLCAAELPTALGPVTSTPDPPFACLCVCVDLCDTPLLSCHGCSHSMRKHRMYDARTSLAHASRRDALSCAPTFSIGPTPKHERQPWTLVAQSSPLFHYFTAILLLHEDATMQTDGLRVTPCCRTICARWPITLCSPSHALVFTSPLSNPDGPTH